MLYLPRIAAFVAAIFLAAPASADTKIRIWFDAFIDPIHPGIADFSHATTSGRKVIKAPDAWAPPGFDIKQLKGTCFSTDDRSFDPSPTASARGRVDFVIDFAGRRSFSVKTSPGRPKMKFIGLTRNLDCISGNDLRSPQAASDDGIDIGDIKSSGFLKLFNVRGSIGDPYYKVLGIDLAPKIDFEFIFEYSVTGLSARIYGSTGVFPSFEGYYQINDEPVVAFLKRAPNKDATPFSLFDFGTGFRTTNFEQKIDLKSYLLP